MPGDALLGGNGGKTRLGNADTRFWVRKLTNWMNGDVLEGDSSIAWMDMWLGEVEDSKILRGMPVFLDKQD